MAPRCSHPVFARFFAATAARRETAGPAEQRREALAGLAGRVVEVGAGSGLNCAYYPSEVTEVVAVEPEPYLRAKARQAAADAPGHVTVVDGAAEHLPLEDGGFDAGVVSQVLCSVPDQKSALAELHRVLRPGGELRVYEHVRADNAKLARLQDRADWIWPMLFGGCHPNRDTMAAIEAAGFGITEQRRFHFELAIIDRPVAPHVIATVVRT
ncbi:MAG: class I SAM-dependent methyltransferase [Acidimicrobiales bacterium]